MNRARNVRDDARWAEGGQAAVDARAADRFGGGDVPALTPGQGARTAEAVRARFRP